jgi:hypothetical protein
VLLTIGLPVIEMDESDTCLSSTVLRNSLNVLAPVAGIEPATF